MPLSALLSDARRTVEYRRAKHNARSDRDLIAALVRLRIEKNLSQRDVAEAAGVSQQAISKFERIDGDPKLSTVRQYADAVGALICHTVEVDLDQLEDGGSLRAFTVRTMNPVVHGFVTKPGTYPAAASPQHRFALSA